MKVYDMHVHIIAKEEMPEAYHQGVAKSVRLMMKNQHNIDMTLDEVEEKVMPGMYDPAGKVYLDLAAKAGIDKAMIFGSDFGVEIGDPEIHPYDTNRRLADLAKKYPDKFIALAALDPRRPGAVKHFRTCVEEWGMKGLKLHPAAGFYPTDQICCPFYEMCADYGLPIIFHSGAQPAAPVKLDSQRPVFIVEAATRFPDTKMIIAHAAMDLWPEAVMYGRLVPNVYFDISAYQFNYLYWGSHKFYEWLRALINQCGAGKIMWATDHPLPNVALQPDAWVKVLTEPKTSISFTDKEIEMLMGGAAAGVFGIE
jgi:predicted TIM-barrel fold metal-dependent hydrolase